MRYFYNVYRIFQSGDCLQKIIRVENDNKISNNRKFGQILSYKNELFKTRNSKSLGWMAHNEIMSKKEFELKKTLIIRNIYLLFFLILYPLETFQASNEIRELRQNIWSNKKNNKMGGNRRRRFCAHYWYNKKSLRTNGFFLYVFHRCFNSQQIFITLWKPISLLSYILN